MRAPRVVLILAGCLLAPVGAAADPATDARDLALLREQTRPLVRTNPKAAIAAYTRFLQAHPGLDAPVGVGVASALAAIHAVAAKDAAGALAACDRGLQQYGWHSAAVGLVADKAWVLVSEKRGAEAEALVEEEWERVSTAPAALATAVLWQYCTALDQQGKQEKLLDALRRGLIHMPRLADDAQQSPRGWVYERLAADLLRAGKAEEAAAWAKLRFLLCPFDTESLRLAAAMLARVWKEGETGALFVAAQGDPARPIPLAGVDLPAVGAGMHMVHLMQLQAGAQDVHDRISAHLLAGDTLQAMADLRQWSRDQAGIATAAEACRILKAAELGLGQANAFAGFARTGEGANPATAFLAAGGAASPDDAKVDWRAGPPPAPVPVDVLTAPFAALPEAQAVDFRPLSAPSVLAQMAAGILTPEEAAKTGALTAGSLVQAIEAASATQDTQLLDLLVTALAAHTGEGADPFALLSRPVRMRLADYFRTRRDPRAEPLLLAALAEVKAPSPLWNQDVLWLALYYEGRGETRKAIEAYESAERYTTHNECLAVAVGMAARCYRRLGDREREAAAYARIPEFGYGWATGHMLHDRAMALMSQGKEEDARKLLRQPFSGRLADEAKVFMLNTLMRSYYKAGEFGEARKVYEELVAQRQAVGTSQQQDVNLDQMVEGGKRMLSEIERWEKDPIRCEPRDLRVVAQWRAPLVARKVTVSTHHRVPLVAGASDARIKARAADKAPQKGYWRDWYEAELAIEIPSEALTKDLEALLTVSSPEVPGHKAEVKLHVSVRPPFAVAPKALLFGLGRGARRPVREVRVTTSQPFRITQIRPADKRLSVRVDSADAAKEHTLVVQLSHAGGPPAFAEGRITLTTDLAGQEPVRIPYVIYDTGE